MKAHDFFDQIYCINLSRRKDRWEKVKRRFDAIEINPTRWEGLDGTTLGWMNSRARNYMACTISHLMIFNHAKHNCYENILVLEDDVCPHKDFNQWFDKFYEEQAKLEWDIFYLGFIPITEDGTKWDYTLINKKFVTANVIHASPATSGAYAYAIRGCLMRKLMATLGRNAVSNGRTYCVDSWLQFNYLEKSKTSYCFVPQLFAHDDGYSDNTAKSQERIKSSIDTRFASPKDYITI